MIVDEDVAVAVGVMNMRDNYNVDAVSSSFDIEIHHFTGSMTSIAPENTEMQAQSR